MALDIASLNKSRDVAELKLSDGSLHILKGFLSLSTDDKETAADALGKIARRADEKDRPAPKRPSDRKPKANAPKADPVAELHEVVALERAARHILSVCAFSGESALAILADPELSDTEVLFEVLDYWGKETGAGEA